MLYIGTDDGIYRWFHGTPWPIFHGLQGKAVVGLAAPGGGVLVALDSTSRVWESLNNGIDWRSIPLPAGAGRPTTLALPGAAEMIVATARPLGLFRRAIGLIDASEAPGAMARARRLEEAVIGGAISFATRVRKGKGGTATLDRPASPTDLRGWTALTIPTTSGPIPPVARLVTAHEGALYFGLAGQGLWKSGDLGRSWNRFEGLPDEVYAVRFAPGIIAVGTSDGVKISSDAGQTWADRSVGLENVRQVRALEIKPGDPKILLAGAAPKGAGEGPVADRRGLRYALYETKDGGATWKHVTRGFPEVLESDSIADIRYLPDDHNSAAIALASGEIWSTRIDGAWWEPLARQIRAARVLSAPR